MNPRSKSVRMYILKSLIPYTDPNLKLVYNPNRFFNELEKLSKEKNGRIISKTTFKSTYYRAKKAGYIENDSSGNIFLTDKASREMKLYSPVKLKNARVLVVYDIEEKDKQKRYVLRQILRILKFKLIQKSVWESEYDAIDILKSEVKRLGLQNQVIIYEAEKITLS